MEKHVIIGGCENLPCEAKRNTQVPIKFKFTAGKSFYPFCIYLKRSFIDSSTKDLIQEISINLNGVNLPFLGMDGASACDSIYEADEKTKNQCNFVEGKSYIYQNALNILPVFPKVRLG